MLQEITRLWPNVTAEECGRLAADPRISAECEYRRELVSEVMHGGQPEPRPGHDQYLEVEHIANAFSEVHTRTAMATTISQCDGLTQMMSYWSVSDVFEEQGVVKQPFYGGFGLIAAGGIPKPSFYAFEILHYLGDQRIDTSNRDVLVTRAKDGSLVIAVWNLVNPGSTGSPRTVRLDFKGVNPEATASIARVDGQHGDALNLYDTLGRPSLPHPGADSETGSGIKAEVSRGTTLEEWEPGAADAGERLGCNTGAIVLVAG